MTEQGCEHYRQPGSSINVSLRLFVTFLFILFAALSIGQNEISADPILKTGTWKGTFVTHKGMLYKIVYIVGYSKDSKEKTDSIQIKMINLDLEPISEFTYLLKDIKVSENNIKFKIPKEFEVKACTLAKLEGSYSGTCTSTAGNKDATSEITMEPPQAKAQPAE